MSTFKTLLFVFIYLLKTTGGYAQSIFSVKDKATVLYGLKDGKGNIVLPAKYSAIGEFHDDRAFISQNGKFGYINKSGVIVIPIKYTCRYTAPEGEGDVWHIRVQDFSNKMAKVQIAKNNKPDKNGLVDPLDLIKDNIKCGVIDENGKEIIPLVYKDVSLMGKERIRVELSNGKEGMYFYDVYNGKVIVKLEPEYDLISAPWDNIVIIEKDKSYYFFNTDWKDKVLIPYEIADMTLNDFGLLQVRSKSSGLYGYINTLGNEVIPVKYSKVSSFYDGLTCLYDGANYGYMSTEGKIEIPFIYDWATPFDKGKAKVRKNNRSFYIDKNGKEVN